MTLPRKLRKDMKVTIEYDRPISAPIQQGETVGKVVMTAPDVTPVEAPLIAAATIERMDPLAASPRSPAILSGASGADPSTA